MFDLGGSTSITEGGSQAQQGLTTDLMGVLGPFLQSLQGGQGGGLFQGISGQAGGGAVNPAISALQGILQQGPQGLLAAAQPAFEQNFQFGLGQLGAAAPTTRGSAFGNQAIDFATRQNTAFNLFAEQALQNFQGNQISAAGQLGQIGLQQQQNVLNPTLQLLLGALGQGFPDPIVTQNPGFLDFLGQGITGLGGLALGGVFGGGGGNAATDATGLTFGGRAGGGFGG